MVCRVESLSSALRIPCSILALGVDTRPGVCWTEGSEIFSSFPPSGSVSALDFYARELSRLRKKNGWNPAVIAFDPHPLFESRRQAYLLKDRIFPRARLEPVFHHVAHAANAVWTLADREPFAAVVFDGTGYGQDGRVWGGEFFVYRRSRFERVAHWAYQGLPGGDAAIRYPWRMAVSFLRNLMSDVQMRQLPGLRSISRRDMALVCHMARTGFNAPLTSSVGRIFDAVSVILGIAPDISEQGEAAMALERCAQAEALPRHGLPYAIKKNAQGLMEIDPAAMFDSIVAATRAGRKISQIARLFHWTVALVIRDVCRRIRRKYGLTKIYCCGGVFMNEILRGDVRRLLESDRFAVQLASKPLTTDLGIAQGQIAAVILQNRCRGGKPSGMRAGGRAAGNERM